MTRSTRPAGPTAIDVLAEPHHDGSALYVSTQAPRLGERVEVWVRVPAGVDVTTIHVRTTPDAEPSFEQLERDADRTGRCVGGYGADDLWWRGSVTVRNPITSYRFMIATAGNPPMWLTARGLVDHDVTDATDFRFLTYDPPPSWAADAVVYEVFPDRFARSAEPLDPASAPGWALPAAWDTDAVVSDGPTTSKQLFGGDLDGIVEHLDHVEALGANTIYLRPVFPAPSNHRYDASTFDSVDAVLGGEAALKRLADAVHGRGMRMVGDITTNHCGDTHEWFVRATSDETSPERRMFYFGADGSYECWYGHRTLPKFDWSSSVLAERMTAVIRRWLAYYDGWRVDVANMTGRRADEDRNHSVAADLRREIAATHPTALLVAEHLHDASGDLDCDGWHGAISQAGFTRPLWSWLRADNLDLPDFIGVPGGVPPRNGLQVLATMRSFAAAVSWRSLTHSWQLLDSYDCARFRTVAGSRARHLVAVGLQMTLPGTPMISAGAELGLEGRNGEDARVPMPWNRPKDRDRETESAYRELVALRRSEPALRSGSLRWVYADADALVFLRELDAESLLVAARRADGEGVRIPLNATANGIYQADDIDTQHGAIVLPGDGPSLRIWRITPAPRARRARALRRI